MSAFATPTLSRLGGGVSSRTLIFAAGLAPVRRFFLAHGLIVTRVVGVMFIANILLGFHPTRAYIAFGVGIILLLVGIVGMVSTRSRG